MNIWIINHYAIPPSMGGLVRHYYFSKYLQELGQQVRIFTASEIHNTNVNFIQDKSLWKAEKVDGIEYSFLRTRGYQGNGLSRIFNMLEFPLRVLQAGRAFGKAGERPDVVYTSAPTIFAAAAAVLVAKGFGVPCAVEVRDIWPESIVEYKGLSRKNPVILLLYQLEKWLYHKADRLIFTMEGGKDYIIERKLEKAVPLSKIRQINNGVDLEEFDRNAKEFTLDDPDLLDETSFKVIYTGSIRLVNQLGKVLEMAEWLQKNSKEKIRFLVYGEGTEREALAKRAEELGLKNILFKGKVEKKWIPFILSKSDLNLNHVRQTGIMRFGCSLNKQFDYFASARPVLSDLTVRYDLLARYHAGITLPNQEVKTLCEAVLAFVHLPKEEYDAYCQNARKAAADYDYANLSKELLSILQEIVPENK